MSEPTNESELLKGVVGGLCTLTLGLSLVGSVFCPDVDLSLREEAVLWN